MKHEIKISLPLEVYYSKNKKFILNLNNYRNAYYRILSISKKVYTDNLLPELQDLPKFTQPVTLTYTYYSKTKRRIDLSKSKQLFINLVGLIKKILGANL